MLTLQLKLQDTVNYHDYRKRNSNEAKEHLDDRYIRKTFLGDNQTR